MIYGQSKDKSGHWKWQYQLIKAHLRVNISELRECSGCRIAKELGNRLNVGSDLALRQSPGVKLGIWIEATVEVVDPSDVIL